MTDAELAAVLAEMDVPETRRADWRWLARNLGIRNSGHFHYDETIRAIIHKTHETMHRLRSTMSAKRARPRRHHEGPMHDDFEPDEPLSVCLQRDMRAWLI